jgi:hypothetical protein
LDKRSRAARKGSLGQIVVGIRKHFGSMPRLLVASKEYTPQQLARAFQDELDTIVAIERLEAQRKSARLHERRAYKNNRGIHAAFERVVRGAFRDASTLADFGYEPAKAGKRTIKAKTEAIQKAKATREVRKTMGSKQKKNLRG